MKYKWLRQLPYLRKPIFWSDEKNTNSRSYDRTTIIAMTHCKRIELHWHQNTNICYAEESYSSISLEGPVFGWTQFCTMLILYKNNKKFNFVKQNRELKTKTKKKWNKKLMQVPIWRDQNIWQVCPSGSELCHAHPLVGNQNHLKMAVLG